MIIHSFDNTEPIITPELFYGKQKHICDICIVTFSGIIYKYMVNNFKCTEIAVLSMSSKRIKVHLFEYKGRRICFYLSDIGAGMASSNIIEVNWLTGATKFIMFGSAGSLKKDTYGKYIIPSEAYRSEGTSYHYAPPSEYITITGCVKLEEIFKELSLPYMKGRVWTTDCVFRETKGQMRKRREEGCLAVDMELAGVQAVCSFYGFELYDFLVTGDVLDDEGYDTEGLYDANHNMNKLFIALKIAERIG